MTQPWGELAYVLVFIAFPIALMAYFRLKRRIATIQALFFWCGVLLGLGAASWRLLFGMSIFIASSEVYFLINLPLAAFVSLFSARLDPLHAELVDMFVPLLFYPLLGSAVGRVIDCKYHRRNQ